MARRDLWISFRVSHEEYSAIAAMASEESLNVGSYVRGVMMRKAKKGNGLEALEARIKALEAEVKSNE